jgi:hypothetical protein
MQERVPQRPLGVRWAWFIGLWLASVLALGLVAGALRLFFASLGRLS